MRFDFSDLSLFICIVEQGSISQGAIHAHLAVSSASERLKHMEQSLGMPLLERHARGVIPTELGKVLLEHAKIMLQQQQKLKQDLAAFTSGKRGKIEFYANTSALTEFLPSKVALWLQQHPDIEIHLKEKSSEEIIKAVNSGAAEAGMISNAAIHQNLQFDPIYEDHLICIVPHDHHLVAKQSVYFTDLVDEVFVGLTESSALQLHITTFAQTFDKVLNLRIRMNTFEGVCEMVDKGIGIAIMPKTIAEKYQEDLNYKILVLQDAWAKRQLGVCYKDWTQLSPAMKNFLCYLKT